MRGSLNLKSEITDGRPPTLTLPPEYRGEGTLKIDKIPVSGTVSGNTATGVGGCTAA